MYHDLFSHLPSEIMLDILSRLPVRTIMSCKCVCKPWLELLKTREFVNSHLSKLVPALTFVKGGEQPKPYEIIEFADDDVDDDYRWDTVLSLDLPPHDRLLSIANGFLLLCPRDGIRGDLLICNPMTREYIKLPPASALCGSIFQASGFGVSKTSGQYKAVRVLGINAHNALECQVYTIGTGSWRRIACGWPVIYYSYHGDTVGTFLNGNLHWLADGGSAIWCLDLEAEIFTTFSAPPLRCPVKVRTLRVLKDCLCVCDNANHRYDAFADHEISLWLMEEYGDEKSWTKQFIIRKESKLAFAGHLYPIKVYEHGGILMEQTCRGHRTLLYYSSKTRTIRGLDMSALKKDALKPLYNPSFFLLKPSFLPLKSFALEDVSSF